MRVKQQAYWRHKIQFRQTGLAYLAVLFLVAAIAVSMAVVSQNEDTKLKREKEQDWLYVGKQYERAIASYYQLSPNGLNELPNKVDDLLLDKRFVAPVHHLRKAYLDPLTNQHWVQLFNEENQLIGVVSTLQKSILSYNIIKTFQINQIDTIYNYSDVKFEFKQKSISSQNLKEEQMLDDNDGKLAQETSSLNAFPQE
ncbi:MAG: hypothetical protein V4545_03820 [Pseudomonadota bacterium]